jgi:hypothetical protein
VSVSKGAIEIRNPEFMDRIIFAKDMTNETEFNYALEYAKKILPNSFPNDILETLTQYNM